MTTAPELRILDSPEAVAQEAADLFAWLAQEAVKTSGHCRVALSGGSTPRALYAVLVRDFAGQVPWPRVEFFFGDERAVPPAHEASNFRLADEHLFRPLKISSQQIFRMQGEASDLDAEAHRYDALLRQQCQSPASAWPRFDVVLLGLGDDAHTASLFPGTAALAEQQRLVTTNRSPQGVAHRLTLTVPAINQARAVMFLVTGASKARAVQAVLEDPPQGRPDPMRLPARLIHPSEGRLIWLLDQAAAADLTISKQQIVSHEE
jgi:6-phosphogluconolactonase